MKNKMSSWTLGCLSAMLLAGCATSAPQAPRLCPQTVVLRALEQVQDYGQDVVLPENLVTSAYMEGVDGNCEYNDGDDDLALDPERGVDINFTLKMRAEKGPRLGGNRFSVPYFVAVVDPDEQVMAKNMLTAEFVFSGDDTKVEKAEDLHVFVPLSKTSVAQGYRVLVGFQLTEEQAKAAFLEKK